MNGDTVFEFLFAIDPIAQAQIKPHVLGEKFVGVEPDLPIAERLRDLFNVSRANAGPDLAAESVGRRRHFQ